MGQHRVADACTSVSLPDCPVEDTIYGYRPNLGVNSFFIAIFALLAISHIGAGLRWKTYFFGFAMAAGCIGEGVGYAGRVMMHSNPYDGTGFSIQISCLIFSPAFFAAGIYLTLKHIVLTFGSTKSRIPARFYTWIFITCDFLSLLLQAIGGGMAGSANGNMKTLDLGTKLMMAGIVFQVATLIVFASLVIDYVVRTRSDWDNVPESAKILGATQNFKRFALALLVAFLGVFFRSVYRIAEMAAGWAYPIMRDQPSFVVMEGFMILIAVAVLTIFHPGYCFPQLSNQKKKDISFESSTESGLENGQKSETVSSVNL